jgi:hypothetical protein
MIRALVVIVLATGVAAAQPASGDKVDAQSLMQSGVKLLEAKDYLGALAVFKTAYERFPGAKILLNIGTTLKLLGRDADAANAYQRYLDSKDHDPKRRADIQKLIDTLDKTSGRYEIKVTPEDAAVSIDDDDWLHAVHATTWRVVPGKHAITVKRDGYEPKTKSVQVAVGESVAIEIALVATPKAETKIVTVPATGIGTTVTATPEGPRSRFGAFAFGNIDIPNGGAAVVGLTADVTDRLELRGAAILGPTIGGYGGATFAFLTGMYRPYVTAGMPIFRSHGARFAVRGGGGLELVVNRHLALIVEVAVERNLNPEMGTHSTLFVPAVGVIGRL